MRTSQAYPSRTASTPRPPGAILYAVFCTSRQISTGPSSALAAVAGGAVLVTGVAGEQAAQLVAAITSSPGRCSSCSPSSARVDRPVPLQGGRHRVPRGCRGGRGDRRAPEADRHLRRRRQRVAGARVVVCERSATSAGPRCCRARLARRDPGLRFAAPAIPGALVLVVGGLLAGALRPGGTASPSSARYRAGCRARTCPTSTSSSRTSRSSGRRARAAPDRVLADRRRRRAFAARHRYRIDVNQESVAQGMANVGAGVFQGMPVSTSLSASSLNESAGAGRRSRRSSPVGS